MFDVVMPCTGEHSWHLTEGWVELLNTAGLVNRTFRPRADWGDRQPSDDDALLTALRRGETAEHILILGMDWHSQPLTATLEWQTAWRQSRSKKIALIWEDHGSPYLVANAMFGEKMRSAATLMARCADIVLTNHEGNIQALADVPDIGAMHFLPFAIDSSLFRSSPAFCSRSEALYFCGKFNSLGLTPSPYQKRVEILQGLMTLLPNDLSVQDGSLTHQAFADTLGRHAFHLNPPSLSTSLTLRAFEALAAGGCLFQFLPNQPRSSALFSDGSELLFYDADDWPLIARKYVELRNDPSHAEEIGETGRAAVLKRHRIENRLEEIFAILGLGRAARRRRTFTDRVTNLTVALKSGEPETCAALYAKACATAGMNEAAEEDDLALLRKLDRFHPGINAAFATFIRQKAPLIVFDAAFYGIGTGGIARVWDGVLDEFLRLGLRENILVIDRGASFPLRKSFETIAAPAADFDESPEKLSRDLSAMFPGRGDYLFASSYFTTAQGAFNVQIVHDMIPEVLGGAEPVWRHKAEALGRSDLLICVSSNTRTDLEHMRPNIPVNRLRTLRNGLTRDFVKTSARASGFDFPSAETLSPFRYFVYVGLLRGWGGYKNALVLFRAIDILIRRGDWPEDVKLLMVGGRRELDRELEPHVPDHVRETLVFEAMSDSDYCRAMSFARALVYPSAYEGFGLPVLEAFNCGCPVIAARAASIPEAGRNLATYFDPFDAVELADILMYHLNRPDNRHQRALRQSYAGSTVDSSKLQAHAMLSAFAYRDWLPRVITASRRDVTPRTNDLKARLSRHYARTPGDEGV